MCVASSGPVHCAHPIRAISGPFRSKVTTSRQRDHERRLLRFGVAKPRNVPCKGPSEDLSAISCLAGDRFFQSWLVLLTLNLSLLQPLRKSLDGGLSVVPTREWQDALSQRLATLGNAPYPGRSSDRHNSAHRNADSAPPSQRRRLNGDSSSSQAVCAPDWSSLYTMESGTGTLYWIGWECQAHRHLADDDELPEATNELGQLSLNDDQEVPCAVPAIGLLFTLLCRSGSTGSRVDCISWAVVFAQISE